ncbi:MAG: LysR family transcriptional regulator [Acidobacteria bacterium]|nr:LysR family transcriptional regulator [Acidobacteriota bacterium]
MEIRQLRALVAIAETHTFTAAAGRVHVTQAAMRLAIARSKRRRTTARLVAAILRRAA